MMRKFVLCLVLAIMIVAAAGCAGKTNPWLNEDEFYQLELKLRFNKKAIIRYQQAENAAAQDGDAESAKAYREAKEGLEAEMPKLEERFAVLEAERQERLKNQKEQFMNHDE